MFFSQFVLIAGNSETHFAGNAVSWRSLTLGTDRATKPAPIKRINVWCWKKPPIACYVTYTLNFLPACTPYHSLTIHVPFAAGPRRCGVAAARALGIAPQNTSTASV
jgi:hypothetical protein